MSNQATKSEQQSLQQILQMIALSEQAIQGGELAPEEIYELRDKGQTIGRFWSYDLKNLIKTYPDLFETDLEIRGYHQEQWVALFSHPFFQRRSPEILPEEQELPESYMLRIDGEVYGPVTKEEIENNLKENKLLFTDLISADEGKTWGAIHKRTEFDRRKRTAQQLPPSPESDIFALSQFEAMTNLIEKKDDENRQTLNVMAGLAYVGQVHDGKIIAEEEHKTPENSEEVTNVEFPTFGTDKQTTNGGNFIKFFTNKNLLITLLSFIIITAGIIWTMSGEDSAQNSTVTTNYIKSKPVKVYKPVPTPIKSNTISKQIEKRADSKEYQREYRRPTSTSRRKRTTKSRTSFKDSDTYRDYESNYDQNDDYYENNVEQDPVQSALSKEIIDPEEDYQDGEARGMRDELNNGPDEERDLFDSSYAE